MERYDVVYAREHLDELMERARRGEEITISDPDKGDLRLVPAPGSGHTRKRIVFGQWKRLAEIPEDRLLAPLSDEELAWLSGEACGDDK